MNRESARAVLRANDRGGYTVPTDRLYPFQWNWDSGFVAMGWATFDEARGFREIERLLEGQWEDGLVPQIVFHAPSDDYFPGPDVWGTRRTPPTSGITQPPILATAVRRMWASARHRAAAEAHVAALLPLFGGGVPAERVAALCATLLRWGQAVRHPVPSTDPADPRFEPRRYWRGPVWAVVNWMLAEGLWEAGERSLAGDVRAATAALIRDGGFCEYFHPLTGRRNRGCDLLLDGGNRAAARKRQDKRAPTCPVRC